MKDEQVFELLEKAYNSFNTEQFIEEDPIQIPKVFSVKQDIEISGFFSSCLAWGQRKSIIKNSKDLIQRMDNSPYDFVLNASDADYKKLLGFKHRTFNETDLLVFLDFFKSIYTKYSSLEDYLFETATNPKHVLLKFKSDFEQSRSYIARTGKHLSSPEKGSACKRLNMYFRWMTRKDQVDLGIWTKIKPSELICPLDVHVIRVAQNFNLLQSEKGNWKNAEELSANLRQLDSEDPIKYDIALFGLGVSGQY